MKKTFTLLLFSFLITTLAYSNIKQGNFRWRDDSVGESTDDGWLANENTNTNVPVETNIRLRIELYNDNLNTGTSGTLSLYYSKSNDINNGNWTKITVSSDTFHLSNTEQYDEGLAPTDLLTNTSSLNHFAQGALIESSDQHTFPIQNGSSQEIEYCIQADAKAIESTFYFALKTNTGAAINGYGSLPSLTINKYNQVITFNALTDKSITDSDFNPGATSNMNLDITYKSSDETVATISGSLIHIVGAGTTNITASQAGNDTVSAANPVVQTLTVKHNQEITFNELADKTTEDSDFDPNATSSMELEITYESSNESVATISGGLIHIVGSGTTNITASQAGNDTVFAATPVIQSLTVTEGSTGIDSYSFKNLKMYPNPATDIINIELGNVMDNVSVSIIDITGKVVYNKPLKSKYNKIQINNYESGLYFVEIKNTKQRKILKLLIE